MNRSRLSFSRLWRASPPLTTAGLLMLPLAAAAAAGLWLDPRFITGAPAWLKPLKFAISIAIYALTLAWVFTFLPTWPKTRRVVGWTTAIALVVEIGIIGLQAWRGTPSHFNVGTPLDSTLFAVMGATIVIQTLTSVAVAAALWRAVNPDAALGWALRLGMTLTIVGALTGGLMTAPTAAQVAAARETGHMALAGAHTVGAADGGPGLPLTGWSVEHGDLRVPHFIGLHALQTLAIIALAVPRRWPAAARVRLLLAAAASYTALFLITLWQAVIGRPILSPDANGLVVLGVWALTTSVGLALAARSRRHPRTRVTVFSTC